MRYRYGFFIGVAIFSTVLAGRPALSQTAPVTYLALGDSIAFGQTDVLPTSYGDQGYVSDFADGIEMLDGTRPNVINLALSGESTATFFTGVSPSWFPYREYGVAANLNYTSPTQTQYSMMLAAIASERANGRRITHVSFALGNNDISTLFSNPAYSAAGANQVALTRQTLATISINYLRTLAAIRLELPEAEILLPNMYNTYLPGDPLYAPGSQAITRLNQIIELAAEIFDCKLVDVASAFAPDLDEYTYIESGNDHPNATGYQVIANLMLQRD